MSRVHLKVPLRIHLSGPLAVGTGFRRGLIHRTVERDSEGFAYIPASALKGRVRQACEQVAQQVGLRVCRAPWPKTMCSAHRKRCLVCRVFGTPGVGSQLCWQDAGLLEDYRQAFAEATSREAQFYDRTQVQLSRTFGTAARERLFSSEFTIEGLVFTSFVAGWLDLTPIAGDDSSSYELLLMLAGLKLVNSIGGGVSRGAGHCWIELPIKIDVNKQVVVAKDLLENIDLLGSYDQEARDEH